MKNTIKKFQLEEMLEADLVRKFDESKFKTYYVSKYGSIFSQDKKDDSKIKQLSTPEDNYGYPLSVINGKTQRVHRIVVETFIRELKAGEVVNHLSGVKHQNDLNNLEITDYKGNTQHAWDTGLINASNRKALLKKLHERRKLTFKDAEEIRKLYKEENKGQRELSRMYDCNVNTIRQIINNKAYTY